MVRSGSAVDIYDGMLMWWMDQVAVWGRQCRARCLWHILAASLLQRWACPADMYGPGPRDILSHVSTSKRMKTYMHSIEYWFSMVQNSNGRLEE